jgi:hypothetical protein
MHRAFLTGPQRARRSAMKRTPPWERPNPRKTHEKLSPKEKAEARSRARRAGRRYPNLVDNLNVAKRKKSSR